MKNLLKLQIIKNAPFIIIFLLIVGCEGPEAQKAFTGEQQFRTTDPSRLYFNNVRSSYYYNRRKPNTKIDLYTLRRFARDRNRPILYPVIVNNWMQDEAYIFIEKNDYEAFGDTLIIEWKSDSLQGELALALFNKKNQFEFAGKLYEALTEQHELKLKKPNGGLVPIFENQLDRSNFITTMRDYYRLTEVF